MYIKLEVKTETDKGVQLPNGSWIPKSILDNRGLKHPYYHIQDWWLNIQVENIMLSIEDLKSIRKKFTEKEKENSKTVMLGLRPMVISLQDVPNEIKEKYKKYWKEMSSDLGSRIPDYEPRLWGNDCHEVDNNQ